MVQSSLKIVFSFLLALTLMAPVIAPFCAENWYQMVMMGSNNEEETQDHQSETLKKLGEKDLFLHELALVSLSTDEEQIRQFGYVLSPKSVDFDILLPPPESIL